MWSACIALCRLTITDHDLLGRNQLFFGQQNNEMPKDWAINGYYKPSSLQPFSGSLQVGVLQTGRGGEGRTESSFYLPSGRFSEYGLHERMRFVIFRATSNKLLLVAGHILTTGLQKCL